MQRTVVMLGATLVLSLALWSVFWTQGMPLDAGGTLVVVGVCAAAVFAVRWAVTAIASRRGPPHAAGGATSDGAASRGEP